MRITDLPVLYTASLEDVLYIIDTSDTTDFLSGSSKQISLSNFFTSSGIFGGTPGPGGPITGFRILSDKIISDGTTTVYNISSSASDQAKDIFLFVNGVNQAPDINYSLTSSVLTLFGAPFSGSEIEIRRFEISSSLFIGISSEKFISDGLTTDYTITSSTNDTAKDIFLFINGVNQTPDVNYSLLNSNLTLFGAPFSGSEIEIRRFGLSTTSGGGGTNLETGSTYPITSSWSNKSITSSYSINSLTASFLYPISQSLIPYTNSVYSLGSPNYKWKDIYVSTGSIYIGEVILSTSGSTLYADVNPIVTLNTSSGQIQVSGFTASLSSSYSTNTSLFNNTASSVFATTGSNNFNGNQTVQGNVTVVGNLIAQQYIVSSSISYFTSSYFDGSTKFGDSDSDTHQFTGSLRSPNITGSLLGTSSFSNYSSNSSNSLTSSVALNSISGSYSVSSSYSTTSSYSSYSLTASYALNNSGGGTTLTTGSTYPITSSWANNVISSSYSTTSSIAITANNATSANTSTSASYSTTSSFATIASTANSATTATSATSATTATSASYSTTSSYVSNTLTSTSASYALTASYALNASGGGGGSGTVTGSINYIAKFVSGSTVGNSVIYETGSNIGIGTTNPNSKLNINSSGSLVSGSLVFSVEGTQGSLFSVDDNLSGSLMSVNDISGLPILEVFSDDRLVVGTYNSNALVVTGSKVGIGTSIPIAKLQVNGNISGSSFTSSISNNVGFFGTSSYSVTSSNSLISLSSSFATTSSYAVNALTASYALNASGGGGGGGSGTVTGSTNYIAKFTSTTAVGNSSIYETGSYLGIGTTNPNSKLNINSSGSLVSGSLVFSVEGTQGSLFSVDDSLSGSLMSVNDISGLPILEVFSDDRMVVGTYNSNALVVTGSKVGIGTNNPIAKLQVNGNISGSSFTGSVFGTSSLAATSSNIIGGTTNYIPLWSTNTSLGNSVLYQNSNNIGIGTTSPVAKLEVVGNISGSSFTGSHFGTSSWSTNAISSSFSTTATSATSATSASYSLSSSYSVNSNTSVSSSFASTSSYNLNSISSSYALTASFSLNGGSGGTTLVTGSTYPITSSWSNNSITASYALNASGGGGGGSIQTGSIVNQTILYNVTSSQDNIISGLNLSSNKWGVTVVEEWNSGSLDIYYSSCSLLCHFDTINSSGRFIDNSPNNITITSSNDVRLSTSEYKFGGASIYFDGNNDYISIPYQNYFTFGTSDFTVEFWLYPTNLGANLANQQILFTGQGSNGLGIAFWNNNVHVSQYGVADLYDFSSTGIANNTWAHVAISRNGTSLRCFVNGVQAGITQTDSTNFAGSSTSYIGTGVGGILGFPGYVDEFRVTKGIARYTSNFSTQTDAFPNSTSQIVTKYIGLVGGLNDSTVDYGVEKLSDSSLKIRKITTTGQPLSGSNSLSSSVDRVYVNVLDYTNVMITSSYALTASYVAGGFQTGSISNQTILFNVTTSQENTITGLDLSGNKWDVSVIEEWNSGSGDIYYPSCSLLLHFSGSNDSTTFIDNSSNNFTVTSTNGAKITSSVSKFGGSSGFFDGTNDYLSLSSDAKFAISTTEDYTVECWVNFRTVQDCAFWQTTNNPSSADGPLWFGYASGKLYSSRHGSGLYAISYVWSPSTNTWYHVAVTRASGTVRLFVDGVVVTTDASTQNGISFTQSGGAVGLLTTPAYFSGYIDELRVTKGLARYTASFTTQSVQFPDSLPQYETKYIGLVGGFNDTGSDYGVQKLDDTSLKIRKMSVSGTPVSGSLILSSSVDRVYVNVLNYKNVQTTAQSASYALSASYAPGGGTSLVTGSTYPITSSWSTYVVNAPAGESFHPFLLG